MFDEDSLNPSYSIFVFSMSSLNPVVENHYADTSEKELLRKVVDCKEFKMQQNFIVASRVLSALYSSYPEKDGIINCIKGMLHEEGLPHTLSPIESTIKLAQLKQFDGGEVFIITEDEYEKSMCDKCKIMYHSPRETLDILNEMHKKLTKS